MDCPRSDSVLLSRENFLAHIHDKGNESSTIERINLIREADEEDLSGWRDTASINTMVVRLTDGLNEMYFDDTFTLMDVFGSPLKDSKYSPQCILFVISPSVSSYPSFVQNSMLVSSITLQETHWQT